MLIESCQILVLCILARKFIFKQMRSFIKLVKLLTCLKTHKHVHAEVYAEPKVLWYMICICLNVLTMAFLSQLCAVLCTESIQTCVLFYVEMQE